MKKTILAIIPARGGSKGVINKNLQPLLSQPLLNWTIEAAKGAALVDRVVVSSDSEEIKDVALTAGADVPFLRPPELAHDSVHSSKVITHALDWLEANENYAPDIVVMLLPTSPFRQSSHINDALNTMLNNEDIPAVIGVNQVNKHPAAFRLIQHNCLTPLIQADNLNVQRQEAGDLYAVNGSIYIIGVPLFREKLTFHVEGAAPYVLPKLNSLDIDSWEDFRIAEVLGEKFIVNKPELS